MKIVSADQMREIEQRAAQVGLPSTVLMERAGLAVAQEIQRWLGGVVDRRLLVLVGPGNNGGDGLVAARHLHDWGAKVYLYLTSHRTDTDPNYSLCLDRGIGCTEVSADTNLGCLNRALSSTEVTIDALFGTGRSRPLEGAFKEALQLVKATQQHHPDLKVVALDLPSGLDPDSGEVDPSTVAADLTITLGYPKLGLFAFPGAEFKGRLTIVDIGIPPDLAQDISVELITEGWARAALPPRPSRANKGSFGKVLVVAGSANYLGAAYLAAAAATRVGAGLVTLACAKSLHPILATKLTEVTFVPLPESEPGFIGTEAWDTIQEWLPQYDVLLLGCGLSQRPPVLDLIKALFSIQPPAQGLVLDADALNTLAKIPQWWEQLPENTILTPHPGEMARLWGTSVEEIEANRLGLARRAASEWRKTVILKGAYTVIASFDQRVKISPFANPGLASAGTGDVLAGTIAGFLAQGLSPFDAAALGVYLHGAAGESVREELGDAGMVASDLLPVLPLVIKRLKEGGPATKEGRMLTGL